MAVSDLELVYGRLRNIDSGDVRKEYGIHGNVIEKSIKRDGCTCFKYNVFLDRGIDSCGRCEQHDAAYDCNDTQYDDARKHCDLLFG